MDSSERAEGFWIPRLNAEADACDADFAQKVCFIGAQGGGVCLEGPLLEVGEVDPFGEFLEEVAKLFDAEGSGSSATEVEGFWGDGVV